MNDLVIKIFQLLFKELPAKVAFGGFTMGTEPFRFIIDTKVTWGKDREQVYKTTLYIDRLTVAIFNFRGKQLGPEVRVKWQLETTTVDAFTPKGAEQWQAIYESFGVPPAPVISPQEWGAAFEAKAQPLNAEQIAAFRDSLNRGPVQPMPHPFAERELPRGSCLETPKPKRKKPVATKRRCPSCKKQVAIKSNGELVGHFPGKKITGRICEGSHRKGKR